MKENYIKNYVKIYFWHSVSMLLSLASMFVVTPLLSGSPAVYGVYTVCISFTFFLGYTDIGFINASYKYASESIARGDKSEELRMVGFTGFVIFFISILFSMFLFYLSSATSFFIHDISLANAVIASKLFLILAVFAPFIALQRIVQMIFAIRLEEYIFQRLSAVSSAIRLISAFYFFCFGNYDIVGYFLFFQLMSLLTLVAGVVLISKRYDYDLFFFLNCSNLRVDIYRKTKKIAFNALFVTLMWVLFYEFDNVFIAKYMGAEAVARYNIGLIVIIFLHALMGIIYKPFQSRFNHFKGLNDEKGLKQIFINVLRNSFPIFVFPVITIVLLSAPLVMSWVGSQYQSSVILLQLLCAGYVLNWIAQPTGILLLTLEKLKLSYAISTVLTCIYWLGIWLFYEHFGINAIAFFKLIGISISGIWHLYFVCSYLEISWKQIKKKLWGSLLLPLIGLAICYLFVYPYLPFEKSKQNLLIVIFSGIVISMVPVGLYYWKNNIFIRNNVLLKMSHTISNKEL